MFVPCKPQTLGNEWHTISWSDSGILFRVDLVEGKYKSVEQPPPPSKISIERETTRL